MRRAVVLLLAGLALLSLSGSVNALDISLDREYHVTPPADTVKAGDVVNVFVTMRVAEGSLDSNLTTVLLVDGEPRFFQNVSKPLAENETMPLWYAVALPAGNFTLEVMLDPDSELAELTEANNRLSFDLYVRPWNDTGTTPTGSDTGKEESPFRYLPYVMVGLILLVVAVVGIAIYSIEKRRVRREEEERELLRYR